MATIPVPFLPSSVQAADAAAAGVTPQFYWVLLSGLCVALVAALGWVWFLYRGRKELKDVFGELQYPRLVTRPDGTPVAVTKFWNRLLGNTEGSLDALKDLVGKDGPDAVAKFDRLLAAAKSGESADEEFRLGCEGIEHGRISVRTPDPRGGNVFWHILDISRHYRLEREIRTEQEKLIEFVENAPIGFYSVDRDGRFIYVNPTFAQWVGKSESELTGGALRLSDVLPEVLGKSCAAHSPLPHADGDAVGETRFIGVGGEMFEGYVTQTVVVDEPAGTLRTRTLVRHLTAEQEFAEAVRVSEERFHRFFENAPVGIVLLDSGGRITECNQVFGETIETDCDDAVDKPFLDFVRTEDREKFAAWISTAYEAEESPNPIDIGLGDGDDVAVSLYAAHAESAEDDAPGLIVHVFDMSEQKRIEAQFFQSQKMELVGQLAGGIAHDFNNLLTAMIGFCDLLLLRHTPRDQSFADIQQIKQNANRAANLVRQLLAFSRQQTLQPKVLDMTEVLSETSYLLRRLIGAGIELKFYHGRDLWLMTADQGQFEQVVINLAVNARDAMEGNGTLTIRTSNVYAGDPRLAGYKGIPDGDYVLLEMQDTGAGIPDDVIEKIFEPFFTTKEVGAGTGLGLSTVYGIVKQSGGYVFADSVSGEGAKFSVYLPRYREEDNPDAQPVEAEEEENAKDLTGAGTVMLVEDEDAVRLFGARALRNKGYAVVEAKDGEGALEILNGAVDGMATTVDGDRIDLLITDVVMPGVDGPSLVREVRDRYPELKVIFISGYTEDSFRQKLGDGETVEFLSKPFTLQQLAGKVKEVMDGSTNA